MTRVVPIAFQTLTEVLDKQYCAALWRTLRFRLWCCSLSEAQVNNN